MNNSKKKLNEQVKRNRERFPDDFMFQLSEDEKAEVVANCDHLSRLKYSHSLPYVFTEHGAIMGSLISLGLETIGFSPMRGHRVIEIAVVRLVWALQNRMLCTLQRGRRCLFWMPNHRLETVAQHLFGNLPAGAKIHRSLEDARLTARVWSVLAECPDL